VIARKDVHSWTFKKHPDGSTTLVQNICIPGITLYRAISTGVSGLGVDEALDPVTAVPDLELALYPTSRAPTPPSPWGPALAGAAVGAAIVGALWWQRG
jgi:hypothetical protein